MMRKILKNILKWSLVILLISFLASLIFVYFYEEKIKQHVVSLLNEDLNTKIEVQKINLTIWKKFPNASLEFKNIVVKSSNQVENNLLEAGSFFVSFNFIDIINNDIKIKKIFLENAKLNIEIDKKGIGNFDILRPKENNDPGSSASIFEISKIQINNTIVNYVNRYKSQSLTFLIHKTEGTFHSKSEEVYVKLKGENFVNQI
ncbi:MAG: AsmA family protein, partial [Cytophagales bacterium]